MSNCKLLLSCMRAAQRCWRGHKSDVLSSTGEGGWRGVLESSYTSLTRALGMQEDREESSAPRMDFSGQLLHITQGACLLPCHEKPLAGIYNQFCSTGVSPASPGPPAQSVSHPRCHKLYNTERKRRRKADLAQQWLLLHDSTTSPLQASRNLTGNSTSTSEC